MGFIEIVQILPGNRSASIGNPLGGLTARYPRASSSFAIARATSLVSSMLWWNSLLATERVGARTLPRFIFTTNAIAIRAPGSSSSMSARCAAISSRSTDTSPTSSAPRRSANARISSAPAETFSALAARSW